MPDSGFIFAPAQKLTTNDLAALNGGYVEFYDAGTSTPKAVYSDKALTVSLGSTVYLDSTGAPVASSGSSTRVTVYTGAAAVKLIIKTSAGVTLQTIDNLQCAQDTSLFGTGDGAASMDVDAVTTDKTLTAAHDGHLQQCDPTGGTFTITLTSAITLGNGWTATIRHDGTANQVKIATVSGQTIKLPGGSTTAGFALTTKGQTATIACDGAGFTVKDYLPPNIASTLAVLQITARLTAPPATPNPGARYIITGTPTGAWSSYAEHDVLEADGQGTWTRYTPPADAGWIAYVNAENLHYAFVGSAWVAWSNITAPEPSALPTAQFEDQKSNGTAGGTSVGATWTTRTLNTSVRNDISGCSLASNKITLPTGNYFITARSSFVSAGNAQIRFKSATTSKEILGPNTGVPSGGPATAHLTGYLTLTDAEEFSLDYIVESGAASTGLGIATSFSGTEIYSAVSIIKIDTIEGPQGDAGPQGNQGADGADAGWKYTWSSNTSASDPSSGGIKGNNATLASITALYISETDADANGLAAEIAAWDDSTSSARATVKVGNASGMILFRITGANTDNGTWVTLSGSVVASRGSLTGTVRVAPALTGDKGDTGATGSTGPTGSAGATGATGPNAGLDYAFNTATSGDPGSGKLLFDSATIASITQVNISETGRNGEALAALLATWDDSTNTAHYGHLRIFDVADRTKFIELEITGTITDAGSYRTIPVTYTAGGTLPSNNAVLAVIFERTGNKGADGAGSGDVVGPASSTNNSLARFDGTTGKLLKDGAVIGTDVQAYAATLASWSLITRASGFDTFAATPSSDNLASLVTDETGTGALVFANSPTLVTPALGTPASGTLTNCTGLPLAGVVDSTSEALGVGTLELGHATDTTLSRSAAGRLAVEGKNAMLVGQTDALTAGFSHTAFSAGTKSSGTYTPAESDGSFQTATNGGAHTLAPPTNNCSLVIQYTNNGSAGTITTSGFTKVTGSSFTTTNGDDFMCYITKLNTFSHLHVQALQ